MMEVVVEKVAKAVMVLYRLLVELAMMEVLAE
jgi:hypothetical protein